MLSFTIYSYGINANLHSQHSDVFLHVCGIIVIVVWVGVSRQNTTMVTEISFLPNWRSYILHGNMHGRLSSFTGSEVSFWRDFDDNNLRRSQWSDENFVKITFFVSLLGDTLQKWPLCLIPPLHRGCDLCASLVWPHNWPGRRWRQKGGRTVALVVQGWHIGRSDIAMDAMVAVKFWACSKQSLKGRRGGRSLTGRSKEAGWRHPHRRGRRMDAQWSAIGRPVKNANIVYQFERHVCLPCATIVPPLADQWRPLSDHCGDHCASIQRPRQHLSHHGNGSAFTLPSLRDLLCHYSSFGRSRKAHGSCCSSLSDLNLFN